MSDALTSQAGACGYGGFMGFGNEQGATRSWRCLFSLLPPPHTGESEEELAEEEASMIAYHDQCEVPYCSRACVDQVGRGVGGGREGESYLVDFRTSRG